MLPSEFPELANYPHLKRLLQVQVDMLIADLRTLLRLPADDLAGCNITAGAALFNLIAGVSVCLYNASLAELSNRGNRGRRFKDLLAQYYPWLGEVPAGQDGSIILYERARNPLAHSLGLEDASKLGRTDLRNVFISKRSLTAEEIDTLEISSTRPSWIPATLEWSAALTGVLDDWYISVPTLYWGLHRTLHALFSDTMQAQMADALAQQLGYD